MKELTVITRLCNPMTSVFDLEGLKIFETKQTKKINIHSPPS